MFDEKAGEKKVSIKRKVNIFENIITLLPDKTTEYTVVNLFLYTVFSGYFIKHPSLF